MLKHLFYSLLITFLLLAIAEFIRPGFATNFLNINWLFLALIVSGILALTKSKKNNKLKV
ncbi:MAG: hypothetical protein COU51_02470 [Parcubacteria group bacterium CG10_big_fil_rev_8_21_14_0_10_36_14]|nr:MAG: hypothetical protein COU51_02470 [Parcubacteria group bacterium CG10_big_fil_rev_8_21_14_0_10_36_14]